MSIEEVAAAVRAMLMLTLLLVTPFLAAAMLASIIVSVAQASARINDLTLSFVPRFAATIVVLFLGATWVVTNLTAFIERSITAAGTLGR